VQLTVLQRARDLAPLRVALREFTGQQDNSNDEDCRPGDSQRSNVRFRAIKPPVLYFNSNPRDQSREQNCSWNEVGELQLATQAKLLRILQNREIQRIGSLKPKKVDVRIVAATNRDLRAMVRSGHFCEDLFFRFALIELKMPRLAERVGDLQLLENHFLDKFAGLYGTARQRLSRRARLAFKRYSWPGNVRELENVLGYCCMMCQKEIIDVSDFPERFRESLVSAGDDLADLTVDLVPLEEMRRQYIARVLARVDGNRAKAARILRIGRTSLHRYLKES
jgi:transcriptional regulator with PAS, ATPase and Fis domain